MEGFIVYCWFFLIFGFAVRLFFLFVAVVYGEIVAACEGIASCRLLILLIHFESLVHSIFVPLELTI